MSVTETEKKFVIRHVVKVYQNSSQHSVGNTVTHFNVPWRVYVHDRRNLKLECLKILDKNDEWSIEADVELRLPCFPQKRFKPKTIKFPNYNKKEKHFEFTRKDFYQHLVGTRFTIEVHVKIKSIIGICEKVNVFESETGKEFSDVVLKVGDQKFYVNKMYLSFHSTYFKTLFSGNFVESKKSEIELKDVEPAEFQDFLELICGFSTVNDETCAGILKLADMYDAKAATQRCEDFLISRSKKSLKERFDVAMQYKLNRLTEKCLAEIQTASDVSSVMPEDPSTIDHWVWKVLVEKLLAISW